MNAYKDAIIECMGFFAKKKETIFLGQQVNPMDFYGVLRDVPKEKRWELPATEEMQTGMAIGLALEGYLPISVYQRIDFMWRAADQMFNHLDKMGELTGERYNAKVILFTTIGTKHPFDVGPQHYQDLIEPFKAAFNNVEVIGPRNPSEVKGAFMKAYNKDRSFMIVVRQDLFNE